MRAERKEPTPEHEDIAAREQLTASMGALLESRGINAETVLARGRRITVTLDYFYDDDRSTVTPAPLLDFVSALYPERKVGIKAIAVSFSQAPGEEITSSIGITVSNQEAWAAEAARAGAYRGIMLPNRQVVVSDYLHLAVSDTPMRYACSRFPLSEWLHYQDGIRGEPEEGVLSPAIVRTVAALLPDQDIYMRRLGPDRHAFPDPDPDLILPPPQKVITIV